ncbi:MAG: serine/threonine-protein kinase [Gemmatales bacterium]
MPDSTIPYEKSTPLPEQTEGSQPAIGSIIDSQYHVIKMIGSGGMGIVYQCRDIKNHNRLVALKFVGSKFSSNSNIINKFRNESELITSLSHANIAIVYNNAWNSDGTIKYIVMEYIEGVTTTLFASEVASFSLIVPIIKQICNATSFIHSKGLVHCDISPSNIIINVDQNTVKLIDFGLARYASIAAGENTISGKYRYMAPEVIDHCGHSVKSDIFSIGVVAYEMLFKKHPYAEYLNNNTVPSADDIRIALSKVPYNHTSVCSQYKIDKKTGAAICSLLEKCMKSAPEERPALNDLIARLELFTEPKRNRLPIFATLLAIIVMPLLFAYRYVFSPALNAAATELADVPLDVMEGVIIEPADIVKSAMVDSETRGMVDVVFRDIPNIRCVEELNRKYKNGINGISFQIRYVYDGTEYNQIRNDRIKSSHREFLIKLREISHVSSLRIDKFQIDNEVLKGLGSIPGLKALYLGNWNNSDYELSSLSNAHSLEYLALDTIVKPIFNENVLREFKMLKSLYLGGYELTDDSIDIINAIPRIEKIYLSQCSYTNKCLLKLLKVKVVIWKHRSITPQDISIICNLPSVSEAYFDMERFETEVAKRSFIDMKISHPDKKLRSSLEQYEKPW